MLAGLAGKERWQFSAGQRAVIILIAALATRIICFGNPVVHTDEEFYFAAARAMTNGAVPFVDIWDRKPIGLFLIYFLPASLPDMWGIWLYQAMAWVSAAATAMVIARLAEVAGWQRGGLWAGIAYLGWITIAGGQGGQSPIFYNLLMALAALLIIECRQISLRRGVVAMALVGVAIQIKYTVGLEGLYFGLWMMVGDWRGGRPVTHLLGRAALFASAAAIPTLAALWAYASMGELPAFLFANFESIFLRNADSTSRLLNNLAETAAILLPLLALAAAAPRKAADAYAGVYVFLAGWVIVALLAFLLIPPWFDHSILPVMLPACVMAAGAFLRPLGQKIGMSLAALAIVVGQVSLLVDRKQLGTAREFAELVNVIGRGPGCLYVYAGTSMLYPATGRCAMSPYVFPSHIARERERGATGMDQMAELNAIFRREPEIVVASQPYKGERQDTRALALAYLEREYHLLGTYKLGRKQMAVYRRQAATTGREARLWFN